MTKQLWIFLAGAAAAWAQGQTGWIATSGSKTVAAHVALEGQTGPVVGKPLAATEVRRSEQVLSDGTRIEGSDTSRFYRDSQGRMRLGESQPGGDLRPRGGLHVRPRPAAQHLRQIRDRCEYRDDCGGGQFHPRGSYSGNTPPDRPSHADLGIPFRAGKQAITVREGNPADDQRHSRPWVENHVHGTGRSGRQRPRFQGRQRALVFGRPADLTEDY